MIPARDIIGGLLVLAIWITLLGLSSLAAAATLQPGQSLTVECKAGSTPTPTPPPKPTPPPPSGNCPKPEFPTEIRTLRYGKDKSGVVLNAGKAVAFQFNPRTVRNGQATIALGPHFARGASSPSNMNTMTLSKCPGDFNIKKLGRNCYGAGGQSTIDLTVNSASLGACVISTAGNVPYYLNITPMNPITRRSTCRGNCGVIFSVK